MLFCSNFNGTWDQYIDAFADGIPGGLDLFWYSSTKYPHSIPISGFKEYIRQNQVDTIYYYNATPGSAQRDIKLALKLAEAIRSLVTAAEGSPEAFEEAYKRALRENQGGFGAPGYAPVASLDTELADERRCRFVHERWSNGGKGPPKVKRVLKLAAAVGGSPHA